VPAGKTWLGTWNGSLTVITVFLFQSSAGALGANAIPSNPTDAIVSNKRFMLTPYLANCRFTIARSNRTVIRAAHRRRVATRSHYWQMECQSAKSLEISRIDLIREPL
jgi:hypothetical protein